MFHVVRDGGRAVVAAFALVTGLLAPDPALALDVQSAPIELQRDIADWNLKSVTTTTTTTTITTTTTTIAPAVPAMPAPPAASPPPAVGDAAGAVAAAPAVQRSLVELVSDFAAAEAADADQSCLAGAVYFEARGESIEGQLAVAEVVLNRAASGRYPSEICAVVTQPRQFSFIRNGRFPRINKSSEAWRTAVAIAHIAREQLAGEIASNVLWYHASYVSPGWGRRLTRVARIGSHIFYS